MEYETESHLETIAQAYAESLRPPRKTLPSEWAEENRILPSGINAEGGRWRNKRTPYLVGIMDACCEKGNEGVVVMKGAQLGGSEAFRNVLGWCIDVDPGEALFVMPTEKAAKEAVYERITPLIKETPCLARHILTGKSNNTLDRIGLDSMNIYNAWSGSAQALATRPIRRAFFDEVDKYLPFKGHESDPISLGKKRLHTYMHRARWFVWSTPTTTAGNIFREWQDCTDQRSFHVPCPHCKEKQKLVWGQVKFPEAEADETHKQRADRIKTGRLAYYECLHCNEKIDHSLKSSMLRRGEWVGTTENNTRIGFHISTLYSPWVSWSDMASEWLLAQGNPAKLMDFANSYLGEPWEERVKTTDGSVVSSKAAHGGEKGLVPDWTEGLFCTADVQKDHIYYVIRAWATGSRSQLVKEGICTDFKQLKDMAFGGTIANEKGEALVCHYIAIDARYRTDEVYAFAQTDPARILPVMGSAHSSSPPVRENTIKGYNGVIRRTINTDYWKTFLHGLIHSEDETQWLIHSEPDEVYIKHMQNEHMVFDYKTQKNTWKPVAEGRRVDWWDCEVYQCVLAQLTGLTMQEMEDITTR